MGNISNIQINIRENISHKFGINSFNLQAIYIKTSDSKGWECKPFSLEFLGFLGKDHIVIKLQSFTSFISSP